MLNHFEPMFKDSVRRRLWSYQWCCCFDDDDDGDAAADDDDDVGNNDGNDDNDPVELFQKRGKWWELIDVLLPVLFSNKSVINHHQYEW